MRGVNVWSRLLGSGHLVNISDSDAALVTAAWDKRDNLVHALLPRHLEITEAEARDFALAFTELEIQAHTSTSIEIEKWALAAERGRSQREKDQSVST